MQETQEIWARSLGREALLEYEMTTTEVLLPGEPHGQRSLLGHSPWGCRELDMTELNEHTKKATNDLNSCHAEIISQFTASQLSVVTSPHTGHETGTTLLLGSGVRD